MSYYIYVIESISNNLYKITSKSKNPDWVVPINTVLIGRWNVKLKND